MLELIALSAEIAKYNQLLLHHNDMLDKRNFNPEKCELIREKVTELQDRFFDLKLKWFD